jgi:hypothetical protein
LRYTISEAARRKVQDRLLLLNHQRHDAEVEAGLFATKSAKGKTAKGKKVAHQNLNGKFSMKDGKNGRNVVSNTIITGQVEEVDSDLARGMLFSMVSTDPLL